MTEAPPYCIGKDPYCPCQDGDVCHYRNASDGTKGWPVAPQYRQLLQELVDAIDFQCDPPGGDMSDVGWDQWQAASDTQYEEALEAARAALSAPLSPDFRLQDQHLSHPTEAAVQVPPAQLQKTERISLRSFVGGVAEVREYLEDTAETNSRHVDDWRDDVHFAKDALRNLLAEAPDEKGNGAAPLADSDLPRLIFEAVGHASRCWTPDGVFDTTEATKCAEQLIADVRALYAHTVGAPADSPDTSSNPTESPVEAVQRPSGETER